jgi:hypothetical protein
VNYSSGGFCAHGRYIYECIMSVVLRGCMPSQCFDSFGIVSGSFGGHPLGWSWGVGRIAGYMY